MLRCLFLIAILFTRIDLVAAELPSRPLITFTATGVAVSELEPGATVYVYSLGRELRGTHTNVVPREKKLVDDDRDGQVTWDLGTALPWRSIWLAVEMGSGRYAVGIPPQYRSQARQVTLTADHLKRDGVGEIVQFGFRGSIVEFVLVRPKTGEVWGATVVSGGAADEAVSTDKVRLSVVKLGRRTGTIEAPPKSLKKDDVVFMVTSSKAQFAATKVEE